MNISLFLTSNFGGVYYDEEQEDVFPEPLDDTNGLLTLLAERWEGPARCLFIASDPEAGEEADHYADVMAQGLEMSDLPVLRMDVCDGRNPEIVQQLEQYDVIILSGGHVPTENAFFQAMGLPEAMQQFEGIVIGISAGTMNCADVVYASPEEEGEGVDPAYELYLDGLSLTDINVVPHFQKIWDTELDGLSLLEDILLRDSYERPFFGLPDGSFILQEDDMQVLFGPAYWIDCAEIEDIGQEGEGWVL